VLEEDTVPTNGDLYVVNREPTPVDGGPVLLHAFAGFLDAGGASRIAVEHILEACESEVIVSFDADSTLDYRARRPRLIFQRDHFESADVPQISIHEVRDLQGRPFLLLEGPEPDYRWGAFIDSTIELVERFDVRLSVGLAGIPWAAPHTRALTATLHGTEPDLVEGFTPWVDRIEVPGNIAGMLELRLGENGHRAMGIVAHVPHYLSNLDFPRSAQDLIRRVSLATGLSLPIESLDGRAAEVDASIDEQVRGSEDVQKLVAALEEQYDSLAAAGIGTEAPSGDVAPQAIPTGDELAAMFEAFLADETERSTGDDPPKS
jgi:predicted ATP-grasp superfamily ATP-dependent carboligase